MLEDASVKILFEDEDLIVVDKPSGIPVHEAASWDGDDVFHLLQKSGVKFQTSGDEFRQGVVSRLDVGTTGVLVLAKTENAFANLKQQFKAHSVEKIYNAFALGKFTQKSGTIAAPIGRHPSKKKRALFAVVEDGKPAITHFDIEREMNAEDFGGEQVSFVKVQLETGRTHQIRVHFSTYGHPLLGDVNYGGPSSLGSHSFSRVMLHSRFLKFVHPRTNKQVEFLADFPTDFKRLLAL